MGSGEGGGDGWGWGGVVWGKCRQPYLNNYKKIKKTNKQRSTSSSSLKCNRGRQTTKIGIITKLCRMFKGDSAEEKRKKTGLWDDSVRGRIWDKLQ